jgi:hypothetical protein
MIRSVSLRLLTVATALTIALSAVGPGLPHATALAAADVNSDPHSSVVQLNSGGKKVILFFCGISGFGSNPACSLFGG